jgi:SPP1 gp7 family putative phage head morphogenesis protein
LSDQAKKEEFAVEYDSKNNFAHSLVANLTEKTVKESAYDPDSYENPYPADDIYRSTGDYTIYESMLKDDQIDAAIQLKKDLVLGSGFEVTGSEEVDEEIIDDVLQALTDDQMIPFEDQLEEILSAYEFGFSLTEKIFGKRDDGSLTLKKLCTRHPNTWLIYQDSRGYVVDYVQRASHSDVSIKASSLIHYINKNKFQNPFGNSDLISAHTAWRIKIEVMKYYAIFLEKYSGGTALGKYPKAMPKQARSDLFDALKRLQQGTAMTLPEGVEVEIMEAKSNGEAFQKALDLFNVFIGRAIMIPDLLGYSGSETKGGSFSLGENQMEVFFKHIRRRRKTLEQIINHHIIKPIVVFNHGILEEYPKFTFKPIKDEDTKELARLWIEAVRGKFYEPSDEEINHFREQVNFPRGEVDRVEQQQFPAFGKPKNEKPKEEAPKEAGDNTEGKERDDFTFKQPEKTFGKKVDFSAIKKQLEGGEQLVINESASIVDDILSRLISSINKKKIVQDKQVDRLKSLKIERKADLRRALEKQFKQVFLNAKQQASNELFKQNFAKLDIDQDFLDFLEEEIFFYIGDMEEMLLKEIRIEALAAIRDGKPFSVVEQFVRTELANTARVSIERWARTKTTEVFNRGRLEFFNSSGVIAGYEYSAILDGRTTVICAGLHGKKFRAGTEPTPPMHWNCRSVLLPITRFEEFEPDTKAGGITVETKRSGPISTGKQRDIDKFIEEEIGEGFSRR